jgi:outer membrane protein OmpA-like peptidoglycan-associated protein
MLTSSVSETRKPMVNKVTPVAAGIKLTLAFGWGKFPHKVFIHTMDARTADFLDADVNIVAGNKKVFKGKTVNGVASTKLKEGNYTAIAGGVEDYLDGEKSFTLTEDQTVVVQLPQAPPPLLSVRVIDHSTRTAINGEVVILSGSVEAYKANTVAGLVSNQLKKGNYTLKTAVDGYLPVEQAFTHSAIDTAVLALHRPTLSVRLIDNADKASIDGEVSILSGNTEAYKANTVAGLVSSELKSGQYTVKSTAEGYIYAEKSFNHIGNDTMTVALQKIKKDIVIVLNNLFFEFNKADILPESENTLRNLLKLMEENPDLKIHIVGHTDNVGTAQYNLNLSKNRAAAVVKWLTDSKIAANRLTSEGKGFSVPVDTNETEEGRANNRRVEFVVK